MRCPKCGEEIPTASKTCPACKARLHGKSRDILATRPVSQSLPAALKNCYDQSWAVIVGINAYQHVTPLEYAINDAEAVAVVLQEVGFDSDHIIKLCDAQATRQNIQDLLSVEMANKTGPNDRLLVFFAGHGKDYTAASSGKKMGYLIPVDAAHHNIASRGISMSEVETWSELIRAKHILYLMDCCYSGLAATRAAGTDVGHHDYIAQVTRRKVRQIITAGRTDQPVIEEDGQGVFTNVLLRGLRGDADINGKGFVTGFDLGHFVESRVHEESRRRQQPMFRYLHGDGEFIITHHRDRDTLANLESPALTVLAHKAKAKAIPDLARTWTLKQALDEGKLRERIDLDIVECNRAANRGEHPDDHLKKLASSRRADWERAAALGWPEGLWLMGRCSSTGIEGVEQDPRKRSHGFAGRRSKGLPWRRTILASATNLAKEWSENHREAANWYSKGAEQGYAAAQTRLGFCYAKGKGVEQNHREAANWYRRAAEQGFAVAQNNLGVCYEDGQGVEQDPHEAVKWYRKASEQGFADAQFYLGDCYENGKGVVQDPHEAAMWFRKAAEHGHDRAKKALEKSESRARKQAPLSKTPAARFNSISIDHDTTRDGRKGMLIKFNLSLIDMRAEQVWIGAYFESSSGQVLNSGGRNSVGTQVLAEGDDWKVIELFMPYDWLHLAAQQKHECRFVVKAIRGGTPVGTWTEVGRSEYQTFSYDARTLTAKGEGLLDTHLYPILGSGTFG